MLEPLAGVPCPLVVELLSCPRTLPSGFRGRAGCENSLRDVTQLSPGAAKKIVETGGLDDGSDRADPRKNLARVESLNGVTAPAGDRGW